jgi:hypothetical protein
MMQEDYPEKYWCYYVHPTDMVIEWRDTYV